ncbi:hypothetical protein SAMN04487995_5440 [Dyadobacter koreensis]|uniref:DUF5723 domain-containing protein n=1 Tax=Dyadobacter koreensis TaxID=408657 RepID=A0A1H7A8F5_9BACT|nr:DUF5723 family protein [Dyadobacter koreensis]SEJ58160.1 hypothetical protein SAMN04487995_5440 [Dyadobacter koreensis]
MKKQLFNLTLLIGFLAKSAYAQQIPGLVASNYGGLYRATENPSAIAGSRYKFQVNLGTIGSSINHRYFVFLGKNSLFYPLLAPHSKDELYGRSRTMGSLTDKDPIYLASEIRWPSAMFSIGKYQGVAFQLRTRGFVQGNNVPDDIRNLYFKRLDTGMDEVARQEWGNFNLVQQSFSELSASYGVQILDLEAHKLRIGTTVKRIFGARIGYVTGSVNDFQVSRVAPGTDENQLILNEFSYESGYSQSNQKMKLGNLFNSDKYAAGWAYDLGATYELGDYWHNEDEAFDQSPTYLLRLAASLTDIGSIKYKTNNSRVVSGYQEQAVIGQKELEIIGNEGADGLMNLYPETSDTTFSKNVRLPQAMHLEADIQLVKGFFVTLAQTKRFKPRTDNPLDLTQPNVFTITPRFEDEDSDFAFPISFISGNKRVSLGAMAHFGPFFIGFSNINGLVKKGGARGSMAYLGFSVWKLKGWKKG